MGPVGGIPNTELIIKLSFELISKLLAFLLILFSIRYYCACKRYSLSIITLFIHALFIVRVSLLIYSNGYVLYLLVHFIIVFF